MTVEELLKHVDIVELISEKVQLKRVGSQYRGLCPFHKEKTPSFYVSPDLGVYHCFGCGASGNAITFVMETEGLSFREAVEFLARKFNIPFEWEKKKEERKFPDLYDIMALAHELYQREFKRSDRARKYLMDRGINDVSIARFQIGYAPAERDFLTRALIEKGVGVDRLVQLGLTRRLEDGSFVDFFRDRILFPIFSHDGRYVLGFSGRVIDGGEPKYLNTPDSPIFRKGEILFGYNLARKSIVRSRKAILVEGQMDVIAMHQMGHENTVASLGTAVTPDALRRLRRIADTLIIMFDSDRAGMKAAHRAMNIAVSVGFNVLIHFLEKGMDPADYLKGGLHIDNIEENSYNITALYSMFFQRARTVEGKGKVLKEFMKTLSLMQDDVMRELYLNEFSRHVGISKEVLSTYMSVKPPVVEKKEDRVLDETYALWAIYRLGGYMDKIEELSPEIFRSRVTVRLLEEMKKGTLEERVRTDEDMAGLAVVLDERVETFMDIAEDILYRWLEKSYELRYPSLSEEEKEEFLKKIYELKRRRR